MKMFEKKNRFEFIHTNGNRYYVLQYTTQQGWAQTKRALKNNMQERQVKLPQAARKILESA